MHMAYIVRIKGRVTGVGFRYATYCEAKRLASLSGYVRNILEGEVEVFVQGADAEVKTFLSWLREGPSYARVDKLMLNEVPWKNNISSFQIT